MHSNPTFENRHLSQGCSSRLCAPFSPPPRFAPVCAFHLLLKLFSLWLLRPPSTYAPLFSPPRAWSQSTSAPFFLVACVRSFPLLRFTPVCVARAVRTLPPLLSVSPCFRRVGADSLLSATSCFSFLFEGYHVFPVFVYGSISVVHSSAKQTWSFQSSFPARRAEKKRKKSCQNQT